MLPASTITESRSSRRRLTIFWALALDSSHTCPSSQAYHMATRWGIPPGPTVAIVQVRDCSRNRATSSSVISICERWFCTTPAPLTVFTSPMDRCVASGRVPANDSNHATR